MKILVGTLHLYRDPCRNIAMAFGRMVWLPDSENFKICLLVLTESTKATLNCHCHCRVIEYFAKSLKVI